MKIKKLEEWTPKELLIFGIVFILIGFILWSLFKDKGIFVQLLFIIIFSIGCIFSLVSFSKLLLKLEQQGKIKIQRDEPPRNFKEFIFVIIIPILISLFIFYWFDFRPNLIRKNCMVEAINNSIDISMENSLSGSATADTNTEKIYQEIYQECLNRHGLKK